ncbi:cytochrome P450 [Xylaria arbuscula]|nr:cytochrome P450 [Xylaria arbuscula]
MAGFTEVLTHPSWLFYLFLLFLFSKAITFTLQTLRPRAFPPGPSPVPILGNIPHVHKAFPFLTFGAWAKDYGQDTPIGIKRGFVSVVVLNSRRLVHELFEKRGAMYADRPFNYMNSLVFKKDIRPAIFENSSLFLMRWRREFNNNLGPAVIPRLRPIFDAEAARLLVKLVGSPRARGQQLEDILVCWMTSVPCLAVCGRRPDYMDEYDFSIKAFTESSAAYAALFKPGLKDLLPFLRRLPNVLGIASYKKEALVVRQDVLEFGNKYLAAAREQRDALDAGKPIAWESMLARILRERRDNNDDMFSDTDLGNMASHTVSTGTTGPMALFETVLMVLAKYPDIQKKVRDEVLAVSRGKAPTTANLSQLKYMEALWNEAHRWRPAAPQSLPHAPTQDVQYDGYRIPKGTTVIMNTWQIQHSEEDYDEPEKFDPERFLRHPFGMRNDKAHDLALLEASGARPHLDFGAGRRICPGMYVANQNLMLGLANIVWAFEVRSADGKEIDLDLETGFVQKTALEPKNFDLVLKLRKSCTEKDIMDHYLQTYEGEAKIMGWDGEEFK